MSEPAPGHEIGWPPEDLEVVGRCPACGHPQRSVIFEAVRDLAFGVAPGDWTMWRCLGCAAGYIDPRPSESSIGRAYSQYYTHSNLDFTRIRARIDGTDLNSRLRVGYYNTNYGYHFDQGLAVGALVAMLWRRKRVQWDYVIRHLPCPTRETSNLLDIGCGGGAFLQVAKELGFSPVGIEPDPAAISVAREAGLDVRMGLLPDTGLPDSHFDHITLSHVFEHVHDPVSAAAELFRILKPGGRLWLNQPNLDSIGLEMFGKYWRGLEAPRHLCLFGAKSLGKFLERSGFTAITMLPQRPEALGSFKASLCMKEGSIPGAPPRPEGWNGDWEREARRVDGVAVRRIDRGENLTLTARKPS